VLVRIPAPSSALLANLLGLFGLIGIAVSVGGLTGNWWWSALAGSAFAVGLSVIAFTHTAVEPPHPPART
jgi:hypothetical protein